MLIQLSVQLFAWAMAALRFYGIVKDGLGYHAYTLSDAQVVDYQKVSLFTGLSLVMRVLNGHRVSSPFRSATSSPPS